MIINDVPANDQKVINIPAELFEEEMLYWCNCCGWSGSMISNVEGNAIVVKNTSNNVCSTRVDVLGVK